jgi:hypothetical protein
MLLWTVLKTRWHGFAAPVAQLTICKGRIYNKKYSQIINDLQNQIFLLSSKSIQLLVVLQVLQIRASGDCFSVRCTYGYASPAQWLLNVEIFFVFSASGTLCLSLAAWTDN